MILNKPTTHTHNIHNIQQSNIYSAWIIYPVSLQGFAHHKNFSYNFVSKVLFSNVSLTSHPVTFES